MKKRLQSGRGPYTELQNWMHFQPEASSAPAYMLILTGLEPIR